ncbi:MAG: hypothetical protein HY268_20645 [Deltaproteobacteria bacterium]|nr:hypothetical protein [Deltaproteobacteria bacterium]
MDNESVINQLREKCWERAFEAFGTAAIFERRASNLRWKLHLLAFLGLGTPLVVGSVVLSFDLESRYLLLLKALAGILTVPLFAVSLWSLVAKWEDKLSYALESSSANNRLSNDYREFAKNPPTEPEFRLGLDRLDIEDQLRNDTDNRQGISEAEKRFGMRAALFKFQKQCISCGKVPESLRPTSCNTCGNF